MLVLLEKSWCKVVQVVAPYVPTMTTGHLTELIFDAALVEDLQHLFAVVVGNVFGAALRVV